MIDKLNNLSDWLESRGLKKESALVAATLASLGQTMPSPKNIFAADELMEMGSSHALTESPDPTSINIKEIFSPGDPAGEDQDPTSINIKEIFPPGDPAGEDDVGSDILYKGKVLEKGPQDGSANSLIRQVQSLLSEHGHKLSEHGVDGNFGNETEKALLEFQKNNKKSGLRETGQIDGITLMMLKSTVAIKQSDVASEEDSVPSDTQTSAKVGGRAGRSQLASITPQTRDKLYKLTQAEVGSQGARAQQAFMETVANRSAIQGKTIDFTVSDRRYYQPIMGEGKSINTLRAISDTTKAKYDEILDKVIGGSDITNGATHNASAGVARKVNEGGYNARTSSIIVIGGETFYSKTYEQKKIKSLDSSTKPTEIPPPRKPSPSGEYTLPKVSFVSVPCVSAANLAVKESREQWDNGNISEKDPSAEAAITKYYDYTSKNNGWKRNIDRWGTGTRGDIAGEYAGKRQLNPVKTRDKNGVATDWHHWSAVYVSWIMKQYDGEGATWFASEGHSMYIRSFKGKRKEVEGNPENHIGKFYYIWFTKEEMDKYGMKPEPGDVIGRNSHCDIYIGGNMLIGGNTTAKNESTGNNKKYDGGTSGPKPLKWHPGAGIIKRVKITGPGSEGILAA
jgi:peptidoglycan hydrolase-like protein with peptidoglycan-binding domain